MISHTEMDQSTKYAEWDAQYGSGQNGGRGYGGRAGRWQSMYV